MERLDRKGIRQWRPSAPSPKNEIGAGFTGAVKPLSLNVKASFVVSEGGSERGPDF